MDKKTERATRKLVDSMGSMEQNVTREKTPGGDNCSCNKKTNVSLRGYGFGEADGEWYFLLTGFKSKEAVESFKYGLVAWIQSENSKKESQGKEIDELLRKTPASAMPAV